MFSFFLIFLFHALRYNYGADYAIYLEDFISINNIQHYNYFNKTNYYEPGWALLCRIFLPFGFFGLIAALAFFTSLVYYHLIKKYVPVNYYWLAVFLYIFNTNIMLFQCTALRQSISIALFLLSFDYLYKKKFIRYILIIALASLFHSSVLAMLPLIILGFLNWQIKERGAIILFSIYFLSFIFVENFIPNIQNISVLISSRYEVYNTVSEMPRLGFGFLFMSIFFVFILYFVRFQNAENSILFKVSIVSFLFIPLTFSMVLLDRINCYLIPFNIFVFPLVILNIKNVYLKKSITIALVVITFYSFYQYFDPLTWRKSFINYQTIFEAPRFY